MATIEESRVFEFYSNVFKELQQQDGGYYPSKHDPLALARTCAQFNISEDEANRIFDDFSKQAADLEIQRVKAMPEKYRKSFFKQRAHDLLCNNRDLPFYKIEGEPSGELKDPLDILNDEYRLMIETVALKGWTIPLNIDIKSFSQLQEEIKADTIDSFFKKFYDGREFRYMCRKTKPHLLNDTQKTIFDECVLAYNSGSFNVCRTSLISILESMISKRNPRVDDVRVMHVCDAQAKEEKEKGNIIKSLCWLSVYQFTSVLYKKSNFALKEPQEMNRHWIEHGRTDRTDDGTDCLKLFNAISTLAHLINE